MKNTNQKKSATRNSGEEDSGEMDIENADATDKDGQGRTNRRGEDKTALSGDNISNSNRKNGTAKATYTTPKTNDDRESTMKQSGPAAKKGVGAKGAEAGVEGQAKLTRSDDSQKVNTKHRSKPYDKFHQKDKSLKKFGGFV